MWTGIKFCEKHPNPAIMKSITSFLPLTALANFLDIIDASPVLPIATARVPSKYNLELYLLDHPYH